MKANSGNDGSIMIVDEYFKQLDNADKFKEIPCVKMNPFNNTLLPKMQIRNVNMRNIKGVSSLDVVDPDTGEVIDSGINENRSFYKRQMVDDEKFIKIYVNRFTQLYDLGLSAQKVFGYFLTEMQKPENSNKDQIFFNMKSCMNFCSFRTTPMIYRGLTELMKHRFIAKSLDNPGHYFVDANTAFNGKRIIIMEEYSRKQNNYFDDESLKSIEK